MKFKSKLLNAVYSLVMTLNALVLGGYCWSLLSAALRLRELVAAGSERHGQLTNSLDAFIPEWLGKSAELAYQHSKRHALK
jgi:hypothetical protein